MSEHRQTTRPEGEDPFESANGAANGTPGLGWQQPPPPPPRGDRVDLAALFVLVDAVRSSLPEGVRERFTTLLREVLLTLRSLIDWYLERLDRGPRKPQVEDIPLD